jgi:hypothetical protein
LDRVARDGDCRCSTAPCAQVKVANGAERRRKETHRALPQFGETPRPRDDGAGLALDGGCTGDGLVWEA